MDHTALPSVEPATSEVGSGSDSHWRALLEVQQQNMMQLIEGIRSPVTMITLPEINPEYLDICFEEKPMEGASLIIALSKALKGSASSWLPQISHAGMTWKHFRELFLARYDSTGTLAATFINVNNSKPKEGECLVVYATRLMTSMLARWKDLTHEEIATSYVLAHVAQFDSRLCRMAFTSELTTRNQLLQEIKATASLKRKFEKNATPVGRMGELEGKRFKPQASTLFRCHSCRKLGHKAVDCRFRSAKSTVFNSVNKASSTSIPGTSKQVTCFRCGEGGHISTHCPRYATVDAVRGVTPTEAQSTRRPGQLSDALTPAK